MQRWENYQCLISGQNGSEELLNTLTHGLGFLFSIVALPILLLNGNLNGDRNHVAGVAIFGLTMVMLYGASTLYHFAVCPIKKRTMKIVDHSFIYLLIAGSYTPFMLIPGMGLLGLVLLAVVWSMAIVGIVFKLFFTGRFNLASTLAYLVMGWVAVIAIRPMIDNVTINCLILLASGGLAYTFGTVFYLWRSLPYNHAIWHLFVLTGSVCHFAAVLLIP